MIAYSRKISLLKLKCLVKLVVKIIDKYKRACSLIFYKLYL